MIVWCQRVHVERWELFRVVLHNMLLQFAALSYLPLASPAHRIDIHCAFLPPSHLSGCRGCHSLHLLASLLPLGLSGDGEKQQIASGDGCTIIVLIPTYNFGASEMHLMCKSNLSLLLVPN